MILNMFTEKTKKIHYSMEKYTPLDTLPMYTDIANIYAVPLRTSLQFNHVSF